MTTAEDKFRNYLKMKGLKFTPERRMVLTLTNFMNDYVKKTAIYLGLPSTGLFLY